MRLLPVPILALGLVACGRQAAGPGAGELLVSWQGVERGSDRMPATATLCARDSTVELLASRDDRGVGLALHLTAAAPAPGRIPVLNPNLDVLPRPAATGAYRYLSPESLRGFVSRDGEVELAEAGPAGLTGRFTLRLVALAGPDTLVLTGSFRAVPLVEAALPCGQASPTPVEIP